MDAGSFDTSLPTTRSTGRNRKHHAGEQVRSAASERFSHKHRSRLALIAAAIANVWRYWRSERAIRQAVRELSTLDDHTLRDLGIRDRAEIEYMVRFGSGR